MDNNLKENIIRRLKIIRLVLILLIPYNIIIFGLVAYFKPMVWELMVGAAVISVFFGLVGIDIFSKKISKVECIDIDKIKKAQK